MKPLVIYHGGGCADGFGAAFAAWRKLGDEAEYLPMEYGHSVGANLHMFEGREVYILDFSFPKQDMDDIFAVAKRVVWLDHHKTAFEMWCGGYRRWDRFQAIPLGGEDPLKHYIVLDDNFSGAYLAWEYFHPGTEVPMLIQHIDDRDRWQFKLEGSKELHAEAAIRSIYGARLSDEALWSTIGNGMITPAHIAQVVVEGTITPAYIMHPAPNVPEGFSREDLEAVADGLDGYEKTVNVGNVTGEGDDHLESTTAYAARFIRAMLAAAPEAKP